jgi:hypothetical protein
MRIAIGILTLSAARRYAFLIERGAQLVAEFNL